MKLSSARLREPVTLPPDYVLGKDQSMEDVLAVEAELLRSEGIDPAWPGFAADSTRHPGRRPRAD